MTEDEAKKRALVEILVRNHDVLNWYIQAMFARMPPIVVNMMFKAFSLVDPNHQLTQENMWAVIPSFINSLTTEQFGFFLDHIGDVAKAVNNEYHQYLTTDATEDHKYLPPSGEAYDNHGANGQREDNISGSDTLTSDTSEYTHHGT